VGRVRAFLFLVLEGSRVDAGGIRVALDGVDELTIGRGTERSLERPSKATRALRVPDARMSLLHSRLVRRDGMLWVEDAGSTNQTIVNGTATASKTLADGDVLELGQTLFEYREIVEEAAEGARDLDPNGAATSGVPRGLVTLDPAFARRLERLARVAASPLAILMRGETGTGKEVLSRAVHSLSKRQGAFVAVNCGAIPPGLVESHLFGHVRGSFSGATRDEPGLVRAADAGTLLLDEIGDLPLAAQAALLRVLQEGEVLPVGGTKPVAVDVRIVSATHKPLEDLVERGDFRRDLYARLAGYAFTIAPLRERRVDLGLLIASLVRRIEAPPAGLRIHREAARAMLHYEWPMNVRELDQCLRATSVLAEKGFVTIGDLPEAIAAAREVASDDDAEARASDEELRRELCLRMAEARGNVTEAARAMGKARQQVQRWIRRFGIAPEAFRQTFREK
jgi:transcriptional regulator with PAS, ATPase and Fis domain